ncbi:TetR/AcrR family transcriptional regulator [Actinomycetospora endophytica]|uniref:TetR/AcrR family transcriptional regulator n=1 Tax=Actinomycetospora endophytica TaxID=2291215 RepID=A0ABS8PET0_9PSEU|nr:TetR/AcrR family transcriptional regulator [Actinomycetospora endophytica]MCD2196010.1 TetR/AcrR family transcriptional regulator [Actinomycetospora endophytica]
MAVDEPRAMRRRPSQERSRATVERILDAGRSVLLERGFEGASTNRIAAAAGVGPGTLYQYFPDKEAILERVVESAVDDLEARITRAFLGSLRAGDDAVRHHLEALLDALSAEADLVRVLAQEQPRTIGRRRVGFARRIDALVAGALIAEHQDASGVDAVAWMLVRTVEHVTISWVLEQPDVPREAIVDELTAMVGGYLRSRFG